MVYLMRLKLKKSDLGKLGVPDRQLVLGCGHVFNELNVYTKLLQFSTQSITDREGLRDAEIAQAAILLRTLAGKVHEGWQLISARVNSNKKIREALNTRLNEREKDSYEQMKLDMGNSKVIAAIRNGYSFHNPTSGELETSFTCCAEEENWDVLAGVSQVNSFYQFSETVVLSGLYRTAGVAMDPGAAAAFINDTVRQAVQLGEVMDALIGIVLDSPGLASRSEEIVLADTQKIRDVRIPFFVNDVPPGMEDLLSTTQSFSGGGTSG